MARKTNPQSSDPLPDLILKGAGASKLVVAVFSVFGLFAMITAPDAGKLVGFLGMATVLLTYVISGAYRVIFLPDRMRYGMFGHASLAYGEIAQVQDMNSFSVRYRRLTIVRQDGKKIRLWTVLPYTDQIVSELKRRANFEYIDSSPAPWRRGRRDNPKSGQ